jgi:hypothetical protein
VSNPQHPRPSFTPFDSWEEVDGVAAELGSVFGPLVIFSVGTGVRPEEAFGGEWRDSRLAGRRVHGPRARSRRAG